MIYLLLCEPVVNKIEEYVTAQQQEFEMSIYAKGPYDLADTGVYLRKERHVWNDMNVEERKVALFSNFWKSAVQGREKKRLNKVLIKLQHRA